MLPVLAAAGMLVPAAIPAVATPTTASPSTIDLALGQVDADVIVESLRLRSELGFEATKSKLASILEANTARTASADEGTQTLVDEQSLVNEWGFIGTAAEATEMKRRDTLTSAVEPMVQELTEQGGLAGHFLDNKNGGRLVVQFADALPTEKTQNALTAKVVASGSSTDDIEFRVVQHSSAELTNAMNAVWEWTDSAGGDVASVVSVEEDVATNRLKIGLRPGTSPAGVREVLKKSGIPADITESDGGDLACASRNSCATPRRGGVGIELPGGLCTVGWVVKSGTTLGAVTAGHCDWGRNSGAVKSGGAAYGSLTGTNALKNGSHADMRYIKIASNAKPWLYQNNSSKARVVRNAALGSVGATSCLFGRNSATPRCGTLTSTNASHRSSTCNCVVYGQSVATFSAAPGDSGGAVASSTVGSTARGILSGRYGAGMHYSSIGYTSTYSMGNLATG
ncbi:MULTISPECIES: chymotrypsin family serine protease [Streptomyces]|uniref:hypothetical protein n=1 Tax=Streptomyces TaxID=1883 RepID=UPI0037BE1DE3